MAVLNQWCVSFTFRDAKGQTRRITLCYQADLATEILDAQNMANAVDNTVVALQALSNAHVQSPSDFFGGGTKQSGVVYGTAAQYQSVATQAKLYYLTTDPAGDPVNVATVTIPAPISSIFEADGITVNPANTNVVALNTALGVGSTPSTAVVACNRSGLYFASFVGGVLVGKKLSRKWTKYTKDPTLTIAGI